MTNEQAKALAENVNPTWVVSYTSSIKGGYMIAGPDGMVAFGDSYESAFLQAGVKVCQYNCAESIIKVNGKRVVCPFCNDKGYTLVGGEK